MPHFVFEIATESTTPPAAALLTVFAKAETPEVAAKRVEEFLRKTHVVANSLDISAKLSFSRIEGTLEPTHTSGLVDKPADYYKRQAIRRSISLRFTHFLCPIMQAWNNENERFVLQRFMVVMGLVVPETAVVDAVKTKYGEQAAEVLVEAMAAS